jgi:hypothetical protein
MSEPEAAPTTSVPSSESECFFITPIGKDDSPERKRSDGVLHAVIEPAASRHGLVAIRADKITEGGHITLQVLEHCVTAKVAVADLTGGNLNVYYEVGIRHAFRQPVVLIADASESGKLPFDLLQQRTIFYTNDFGGAATALQAVSDQLGRALEGHIDSPVQAAATLRGLEGGDAVQQTLAQLVTEVNDLSAHVRSRRVARRPTRIPLRVVDDLSRAWEALVRLADERDDDELKEILVDFEQPLGWVANHANFPDTAVDRAVLNRFYELGRTVPYGAGKSRLVQTLLPGMADSSDAARAVVEPEPEAE